MLVFVVGPSGAGKDTLLSFARHRLAQMPEIVFARRLITRMADHTEDHLSLDAETFELGVARGDFPLYWRANGLGYGLGREVAEAIEAGRIVVANGSRAAVAQARRLFPRVKVVLVTAPPEVLAARISARGREGGDVAAMRLAREPRIDVPPDLILINDGGIEQAGDRLTAFLRGLCAAG